MPSIGMVGPKPGTHATAVRLCPKSRCATRLPATLLHTSRLWLAGHFAPHCPSIVSPQLAEIP